jgi:cobalt-zinc-cadmium efflux system membrane fusion protein
MNGGNRRFAFFVASLPALLALAGCGKAHDGKVAEGAPPPAGVVPDFDVSLFRVDHPDQFPLAEATSRASAAELVVTGVVSPDVNRSVPVISMVSGRVVAIHARLGDAVKAGQVLISVHSDDLLNGFSDYQKAVADEALTRVQLERAKDLWGHGAISTNDLEVARNADDKAKVDIETKAQHLRLLGKDPARPDGVVDITAPVTGVITDQQVTGAAGVQALGSAAFTISDLSRVWIVCDVYENDLHGVRVGDDAEIHLNAYPGRALTGKVGNIGAVLDPNLRTAKVRVEVANPGVMRLGMFATATFRSQTPESRAVVPASAILHLHDRDWVYLPAPDQSLRRVEVVAGDLMADGLQEIKSGIKPGQKLVKDALVLEHTVSQ